MFLAKMRHFRKKTVAIFKMLKSVLEFYLWSYIGVMFTKGHIWGHIYIRSSVSHVCVALWVFLYFQHNISVTTGFKALFDPHRLHKYRPSSLVTEIPQTERKNFRNDHLSTFQIFFILPIRVGL